MSQVIIWFIVIIAIIAIVLIVFIVNRAIRAHRLQASAGKEELIGKSALVDTALEPKGVVFIQGERWTATLDQGRVEPGEEVIVTKVDGLKMRVTKK